MRIPKSFDFIPMGDAGITQAVNDALDKADELRQMVRVKMQRMEGETTEAKR